MKVADKILVAYASRTGATRGVAEALGKTLAENGADVDVRSMSAVNDLAPDRAVVAGSAMRGQKWRPEAMQFLRTPRAVLARKPVAAFLVCITLAMPNAEKYRDSVAGWLDSARALATPVSEGLFAGALDLRKLSLFPDRLSMGPAVALGIFPQGDHRAWAENIRPLLLR